MHDCWNWWGCILPSGYGVLRVGKKCCRAHRVSYETYRGEIPEGVSVLHHCDNPACVNPRHLYLGRQKNNVDDRVRRGRQANAKLDKRKVNQIKKHKGRQKEIAKQFNVHQSTVSRVKNNRIWGCL